MSSSQTLNPLLNPALIPLLSLMQIYNRSTQNQVPNQLTPSVQSPNSSSQQIQNLSSLSPEHSQISKRQKTSKEPSLSVATNNETTQQLTTQITIKIKSKQDFSIEYKNYLNMHREI